MRLKIGGRADNPARSGPGGTCFGLWLTCLLPMLAAGAVVAKENGLADAFHGTFVRMFQRCDSATAITVAASSIATADGAIAVTGLVVDPRFPDWAQVTLLTVKSGAESTVVFVLAPDGQSLQVYFKDDTVITWNRCI